MMVPICLFIALAINSALGDKKPLAPPRSPCPKIFKFDSNYFNALSRGRNTSASITIQKPKGAKEVKLWIDMQTRSATLEPLDETLTQQQIIQIKLVSSRDELLDKNVPHIEYRVEFAANKEKAIPHPFKIMVNGKIICQGTQLQNGLQLQLKYDHPLPGPPPQYVTDENDDYGADFYNQ